MKRISRTVRARFTSRPALLGAVVLLALTSASVAAADAGPAPLGVTVVAARTARTARVGALFAADRAGGPAGGHFCTASVVHSPQRDLIVTAAHCVDGADGDLVFVPGYRDGRAPYGVWRVGKPFVPDGWAKARDEDSDIALAHLEALDGRRVEDVVGAGRLRAGVVTGATAVTLTGYPDSREVPVSCTNWPVRQGRTQQRVDCPDFPGGTSGSPWTDRDGRVVGVLGGYERGGSTADVSYSAVLRGQASALYRRATAVS
ncbi:trypsin-like serine peptidase [Streptomyces cellostaticus]|uniref:trypsin-like serine peptidase n=1 Tax=Streptomyces cellostaticus TaxID=67285 RepID=UPI00202675B9|nr:trypsin-like peptidase domain-containing protein [Streptomyces cellostaticus]